MGLQLRRERAAEQKVALPPTLFRVPEMIRGCQRDDASGLTPDVGQMISVDSPVSGQPQAARSLARVRSRLATSLQHGAWSLFPLALEPNVNRSRVHARCWRLRNEPRESTAW